MVCVSHHQPLHNGHHDEDNDLNNVEDVNDDNENGCDAIMAWSMSITPTK